MHSHLTEYETLYNHMTQVFNQYDKKRKAKVLKINFCTYGLKNNPQGILKVHGQQTWVFSFETNKVGSVPVYWINGDNSDVCGRYIDVVPWISKYHWSLKFVEHIGCWFIGVKRCYRVTCSTVNQDSRRVYDDESRGSDWSHHWNYWSRCGPQYLM